MKMSKKKTISFLAISLALLGGVIYYSNPVETWKVIRTVDLRWFLLALSIWGLSFIIRTNRWRMLLRSIGIRIPTKDLFQIYAIGKVVSNVTPSRAGDPVKAYIIKKKYRHSFSKTLSSVVMEKLGDGFALLVILIIGGLFPSSPVSKIWITVALLILLLASLLVWRATTSRRKKHSISKSIARLFMPKSLKKKGVDKAYGKFTKAFRSYDRRSIIGMLSLSIVIWVLDGVVLWLSFKSIGVSAVDLGLALLATPIIMFVGIMTLLPGSIGSSELTSVLFFVAVAGVAVPQATAATLISRVIMWWMYMLVGLLIAVRTYKPRDIIKWLKSD